MDDIAKALIQFLSADPDILALIKTAPQPPRIFLDSVPQNVARSLTTLVIEELAHREGFALVMGPHGLPNVLLLLECRAASRAEAQKLRQRVLDSRGGNPDNRELNGFAGAMGAGYVVQMAKVENSYFDFEPPVKSTEVGVYIATVELNLWFNSL